MYRSYKRPIGVYTSAASKEDRVHLRDQFSDSAKNREKSMTKTSGGGETTAIISTNDLFGWDTVVYCSCGQDHKQQSSSLKPHW